MAEKNVIILQSNEPKKHGPTDPRSSANNRISYIFNNFRENHRFLHFPGSFFVGNGKIKKLVVSSEKMM